MKKLAIAAAVIAVGAGAYVLSGKDGSTISDNEILAYIPADTLLFSGQLTPFPLEDYLYSMPMGVNSKVSLEQIEQAGPYGSEQERFFVSLYKSYLMSFENPEVFLKTFGLPANIESYTYTLGALPVFKIQVEDESAVWALLDKASEESGLVHKAESVKGQEYRAYPLIDEDESIDMVFAQKDGWLTVTLNTSFNKPELLETALGLIKVDNPISESGMLDEIATTHGFLKDSISFINHVELVNGLTSNDGNMLAKQLTKLVQMEGSNEDPFAEFKTPECKAEFNAIAANWPRTVMGLNSFSVNRKETNFDAEVVIESNNQVILGALAKMRGFIPSFSQNISNNVASMAFGLDVVQLAPALSEIWKDLQTPSYQCEALAQVQYGISEQNPAMLGMMTGMANGVKGISTTIVDFSLTDENGEPGFKHLDALISLSADDPAMLMNMVRPFVPQLANIQLEKNGNAVDVTPYLMLPPEMGVTAKIAMKDNHLVIFSGDKGEALADTLANEPLASNGLTSMALDYQKLLTPVFTLIEESGEPIPDELAMLKDYDMRMQLTLDVTAKGISISTKANSTAK
ncbi:hypothetical protein [uncultured Shewanella sp.]|uniref:hypothetical protein n=1 Tax=uncultured Shewanella sp. TaxID=173975 RepID=UPI002638AA76|nr:hypothetical protein [uncultured Shewanella sp.]